MFANKLGYAAEWSVDKVRLYFEYLIKTLVWFGIGCTLAGILVWITAVFPNPVTAVLSLLVLGGSFAMLKFMKSPASIGLNWAADKSKLIRDQVEEFSDIIFSTMLAIFYVVADKLYELPFVFLGFFVILALLFTSLNMYETKLSAFFKGRFKYIVIGGVIGVTVWQHVLSRNTQDRIIMAQADQLVPIKAHLDEADNLVDENNVPIQFDLKDRDGNPTPHAGGYQDGNGHYWLFWLHKEEVETTFQDHKVASYDTDGIANIKRELRNEAKEKEDAAQAIVKAQADDQQKKDDDAKKQQRADAAAQQKAERDRQADIQRQQREQDARRQADAGNQRRDAEARQAAEEKARLAQIEASKPRPIDLQTVTTGKWEDPKSKDLFIVAQVQQPVTLPGYTVASGRDSVRYRITDMSDSDKDHYELHLVPAKFLVGNGEQPIDATWVGQPSLMTVGKGGSFLSKFLKPIVEVAVPTAAGAIIDGKKGAAIGAAAGGTVVAVTLIKAKYRGKDFNVPSGTEIVLHLMLASR